MKNEYRIIVHTGVLATQRLLELQCASSNHPSWFTCYASSFDADIKHYCQDVNAMDVYNNRASWIVQ